MIGNHKYSTIFYNKKDSARLKDIINRAINGGVVIWDEKDKSILEEILQEVKENELD